jgi:hypothetical protein
MQLESLVLDRPIGPEIQNAGILADQAAPRVRCHFRECRVCLGEHEEQVHDATLSVRQWFRGEVTKSFDVVYFE